MDKTYYIAGRVGRSEPKVEELNALLHNKGYRSLFDWTNCLVSKPYLVHIHQNAKVAEKMLEASTDCDLFILLVEGDIYMAMAEYGAALNASRLGKEKQIFVVLVDDSSRQSLAFTHPSVNVCRSFGELLQSL